MKSTWKYIMYLLGYLAAFFLHPETAGQTDFD
jgi:hypothetical protein